MNPLDELGLLVKAAQREADRRANEILQPLGITSAQAEVLWVLERTEPLSLGELGDLLIAEGGHPSRLVDRLVQAGYVKRQHSLDDRRRLEVSLTVQGKLLARQVSQIKASLLEQAHLLLERHDIEPVRAFLQDYLQGSPWTRTLELRRNLEQHPKGRTEE